MAYADSIIQADTSRCWLCGRRDEKLDRHEPFGGAMRAKSQKLGLWVALCHNRCHMNGVHKDAQKELLVAHAAQQAAMREYGWSIEDFRWEFYKNYL